MASDGGAPVTARGVCWSTSHNSTVSDSHTNDGDSTGVFASNLTGLVSTTTYYVRAYATNIMGTAYGDEVNFTTWPPFYCGTDTVTDIDGNVYHTLQLGNQCWMKENLRTTRYADGSLISTSTSPSTTTAYCFSPNLADSMIPMYGRLYNWAAVMHGSDGSTSNPSGVQGVCPTGWHVPSDAEWIQLKNYVCMHDDFVCSGVASYCAKALVDSIGWNESWATCAPGNGPIKNNATGLSLRPSGAFFPPEIVTYTGSTADYWTSTSVGDTGANAHARIYRILHSSPTLNNTMAFRCSALPVRCVRD